jgi:hypothetical protein
MTKKVFIVEVKTSMVEKQFIRAENEQEAKEKVKEYETWLGDDEVEEPTDRPVTQCSAERDFKIGSVKEATVEDLIHQIFDDC